MSSAKGKGKAVSGGQPQFKQTKLSFGSAFQASTDKQRKRAKVSQNEDKSEARGSNISPEDTPRQEDSAAQPTASEPEIPQVATPQTAPKAAVSPATSNPGAQVSSRQIIIKEKVGDLFAAPPNAVLIHACNAIGSWGGGIAAAFRQRYPDAFRIYNAHCKRSLPQRLIGSALLIAPRDGARRQHYIGCLFTSKRFGKAKDSPEQILEATGPAVRDLLRQIAAEMGRGNTIGEIRMCHINSGLFAVPWRHSKQVIEGLELEEDERAPVDGQLEIIAYSPED
ncbi:hypothetical protein OQA88_6267 [Cercophora sp. LCS_1]